MVADEWRNFSAGEGFAYAETATRMTANVVNTIVDSHCCETAVGIKKLVELYAVFMDNARAWKLTILVVGQLTVTTTL
jgi:hypothetical protein